MTKQLDTVASALHEAGVLKVWSLIITFFGDSILNRGGNVSAHTVQLVLDRLCIEAGAVRTAFSRLANDGWVERQKLGRRSYFQLTPIGVDRFAQASVRIYSPVDTTNAVSEEWLFAMHTDKALLNNLPMNNAVLLSNRAALLFNPDKQAKAWLTEHGFMYVAGNRSVVPAWVTEQVCPADWKVQINSLQKDFSKLARRPPTDPLAALATRTLLIHQWRRLLLRLPPMPAALKGEALAAENGCRHFVGHLYQQLNLPAEQWLSDHAASANGPLPAFDINPEYRFTQRYEKQRLQ